MHVNKAGLASVALALTALGGCRTAMLNPRLPHGGAAYALMPPPDPDMPRTSYLIVPDDVLTLQVFQEPDLSNGSLQVDDMGNIQMPLIGEIPAAGRSAAQLAADIAARLRQRYIVNPQVVVSVEKQASRLVTVDGQVNKPGVYEIERGATLLSAIARAESTTKVARLNDVAVFRTVDGRRLGARFDLGQVRSGLAPDPQILAGDVVVVGFSPTKGAFRDLLAAAPLLNVFYVLR